MPGSLATCWGELLMGPKEKKCGNKAEHNWRPREPLYLELGITTLIFFSFLLLVIESTLVPWAIHLLISAHLGIHPGNVGFQIRPIIGLLLHQTWATIFLVYLPNTTSVYHIFTSCLGFLVQPLGAVCDYRRWPVHAPYSELLGVLTRVTC